jgi:phage gp29-like protein
MTIANISTRISSFARSALAAATRKPNRQLPTGNRQLSPPLALASIIRPQVRERWLLPQVGAITPQYIEMTLRGALAGAHIPQWELFNLMEDTWPRLRKNVFELKMAVRNRRAIFEAYREEDEPESPAATERMKLVSAALRKIQPEAAADEGGFDELVTDILDAWFKGVSVLEIDWQMAQTPALGRFIAPRATRWASPVNYAWDGDLRLGVTDATQQMLAPFPTDRVIVAKCKTKSGSVLGGALLRPLVWWWCAANFSADWLLNLAQVFGLPFRWATYEPTAAQETVDRICAMLQNMGSAGWAAFPAGTSLELKADGQKSGAQTPQGDMLDRADKQCDLLVLGQTLTTDTGGMGRGGGSHALGRVHADVRAGIIDAAAKFAAGVIEQQLIPAILRLNYGDSCLLRSTHG